MSGARLLTALLFIIGTLPVVAQTHQHDSETEPERETIQPRKQKLGWFYGVFSSYKSSYYKGIKGDTFGLPIIGYKGPRFSILGPRASYRLTNNESMQTNALILFKSSGYKSSDSVYLEDMSNRSGSLFGGIDARIKQQNVTYTFSYLHDLQNRSGGQEMKLGTSYSHNVGPFFFKPNIALNYWDRAFTNYYVGIRENESNNVRNTYNPSAAVNYSAGLNFATPILFNGFTRASISHHWLDSTISKSPIVDQKSYWTINLSFTRFF